MEKHIDGNKKGHWLFNAQRLKRKKCFCGAVFETYQPQQIYCEYHVKMPQVQRNNEKKQYAKQKTN